MMIWRRQKLCGRGISLPTVPGMSANAPGDSALVAPQQPVASVMSEADRIMA